MFDTHPNVEELGSASADLSALVGRLGLITAKWDHANELRRKRLRILRKRLFDGQALLADIASGIGIPRSQVFELGHRYQAAAVADLPDRAGLLAMLTDLLANADANGATAETEDDDVDA